MTVDDCVPHYGYHRNSCFEATNLREHWPRWGFTPDGKKLTTVQICHYCESRITQLPDERWTRQFILTEWP